MSILFTFTIPDELIDTTNFPTDTFLSKETIIGLRKIRSMSIQDAYKMNHPEIDKQIDAIILNRKNKRMIKDGFEPGWQENINEYCPDRSSYNRALKEKGLVEIGKDTSCIRETTTTGGYCNTLEFAMEARKVGVELSDQEVDAIISGEYFNSSDVIE